MLVTIENTKTLPLIEGSSKIFYSYDDTHLKMTFKDAIHGAGRCDSIYGTGELRKLFTYYFYRLLESHGIVTHLASKDLALCQDGVIVKRCIPVKMEILVRNRARGHWVDEHKIPLFLGGTSFSKPVVEFCLKSKLIKADGSIIDDPRINASLAQELHLNARDPNIKGALLCSHEEAEQLEILALKINAVYKNLMEVQGWIVEDFKFEVGISNHNNRTFILIDEISPDSSRICDSAGNSLTKDLFRQKKDAQEIYLGYKKLTDGIYQLYKKTSDHGNT